MKNLIRILLSVMTLALVNTIPMQAQLAVVTEETKDVAYDAPASKLVGSWIKVEKTYIGLINSGYSYERATEKSNDNNKLVFKSNGTMDYIEEAREDGLDVIFTTHYTWKKDKSEIILTPQKGASQVTWQLTPASQAVYNALSNRVKEGKKDFINAKKEMRIQSKTKEFTLELINNDFMVLGNGFSFSDTYVKEAIYNKMLAEEKAKEEAAKAAAEAEAKEEAEAAARARAISEKGFFEPVFYGGIPHMNWLMQNSIQYPQDALMGQIEGDVIVQVVIAEDGKICDAVVSKNLFPSLDAEALRVVKELPNFKSPAKQDGVPLKSPYRIIVPFRLPK